tara:strand:- start:108 stop:248 length:141 start_codon:yes stop_codon:yes gene_type:complete
MPRAKNKLIVMKRKKKWVAYDKDGYVLVICRNKRIVEDFAKKRGSK